MRRWILSVLLVAWLPASGRCDEPRPQWRAFWVDAFGPGIKNPEQVKQLVADVKRLNFNTIIAQVRRRGDAYYRKCFDPFTEDPAVQSGFDPLAALLEAAHKDGIQVHAWLNFGTLWRAQDAPPKSPKHLFNLHGPGAKGSDLWLTSDEKGDMKFPTGYFLDAGHPAVHEHMASVVAQLAKDYDIDGVHLDYIRYPETDAGDPRGVGYNPTSVELFQRRAKITEQPKHTDPAWREWRKECLTQLVRRLRVELLRANPKAAFSAALIPWGDGPKDEMGWVQSAPYVRVFQDWHAWRQEGLLDIIVPMNYDRDSLPAQKQFYRNWVRFEKQRRGRSQLIVGQGAYLNSLAESEEQLRLALGENELGGPADGICLFSYSHFRLGRGKEPVTIDLLAEKLVKSPGGLFSVAAQAPKLLRHKDESQGSVAGTLKTPTKQPVAFAKISLLPFVASPVATASTDGNGFFAFVNVPVGVYKIRYEATQRGTDEFATAVEPGKVAWHEMVTK